MSDSKKPGEAIRNKYSEMGVDKYYRDNKNTYENPHLPQIHRCLSWLLNKTDPGKFLDLACGNGACTAFLAGKGYTNYKGCDPYFSKIYAAKFKTDCYNLSFQDLATGPLQEQFDTIICSYALHLCPPTYYEQLLYSLAAMAPKLVVISPSKFPLIDDTYFDLADRIILDRTHCRLYNSKIITAT